jgi:hypothetical protein
MLRAHSFLLAVVCWLAGGVTLAGPPVIYWKCDPVGPDETLMLFGDSLGTGAQVFVGRWPDAKPGSPESAGKLPTGEERKVQPLQTDQQCIKLLIPADWRWGCYRVRVQTAAGTAQLEINRPEVWWSLGDTGPVVSPGGECRLFGKNFWLGPMTGSWPGRVVLRTASGRFQQLSVLTANRYAVTVRLPTDLPAGRYSVSLHHGHGGPAGWSAPVEITVRPAPSWPRTLYNVRNFGAKGDGLTDDTVALRAALERCQKNGGGIVFLPRGTYKITGTLVLPRRTVLRGERREWVWLYVPQKTPEFNTVLAGNGEFAVEELSLVAQTPRRLITAPDVPTMYNMPWGAPAVHGQPLPRANDVRLRRLRLHHLRYAHRVGPKDPRRTEHAGPSTVALCGHRLEISDCKIVSSGMPIILHDIRYSRILRNHLHTGRAGWYGIWGARQTVIEGNLIEGRDLEASYGGFGNYLDYMDDKGVLSTDLAQLYIAENHLQNGFGCEREALGFDSPGNFPWVGPVASADAKSLQAAGVKWRPDAFRGLACLIVAGRGLGQHRRIVANSAERLEVDAPWAVPPDHTSVAAITAYRCDVVIYHNQVQDASTAVELWGGGYNFLIEGNTSVRTGGLWGRAVQYKAHGQHVFLPCYFTQWLNNDIREGFIYEQGPEEDQSAVLGLYSQTPPAIAGGLPVLGNVIRGNRLTDRSRIGLLHYGPAHMANAHKAYRSNPSPPPAGRDNVIEHNRITDSPCGVEIGPGFFGTLVRANRFERVTQEVRDWNKPRRP